jgi:leucyl aminopeptidase
MVYGPLAMGATSLMYEGAPNWPENDRFWRMPLEEDYQEALNSNFADMANVAGREGGAITAACFLWRFTKKYDWAHLDIAGVAYKGSGKEKGATGRPVAALVDYVMASEK